MNTEMNKPSVYGTMAAILTRLNSPQEQKNLTRDLAAIRNSTGRDYEEASEVWPILFPFIPQEYLGNGALTYEEKALLIALQLYAIGQQGSAKMTSDDSSSFGTSLHRIRDKEDSTAMDRRFNTMLTSATVDEFAYHLRQLFKLGKSKNSFSVNFPKLADDLFWYQNGRSKQICLKWARDYYRFDPKQE
ncbi:MAG: type I-E CRISPR-associated protein Cse2/CasB [Eubacteriales bacterium]|nr:type I-E CRISPR-associated protein Cse2/CasB [Eubacteriales bacterium]